MRRILGDYARRSRAVRRGGGAPHDFLDDNAPAAQRGDMLVAVDEAVERLAQLSPRMSGVVECRFFGGLTEEETAEALGVSVRTVQREWAKSRAWLYSELCD
jgi:DNA-directed RNA polymerase specialized sigma subunit, sigma24 homolog